MEVLKNKIVLRVVVSLIVAISFVFAAQVIASNNILYALSLEYDGTTLSSTYLRLIEGEVSQKYIGDDDVFTLYLISYDGTQLFNTEFVLNINRTFGPPRSGENSITPLKEGSTNVTVSAPYFENASTIDIYKDDVLRLVVDVSKFSTDKSDENGLSYGVGGQPPFLPPDFGPDVMNYTGQKSSAGLGLAIIFVVLGALGTGVFFVVKKGKRK